MNDLKAKEISELLARIKKLEDQLKSGKPSEIPASDCGNCKGKNIEVALVDEDFAWEDWDLDDVLDFGEQDTISGDVLELSTTQQIQLFVAAAKHKHLQLEAQTIQSNFLKKQVSTFMTKNSELSA